MKKTALIIATILSLGLFSVNAPVMADDNGNNSDYQAIIFTDCNSRPDPIQCILDYAVNVLSVGVGILGVIGISIVGIQYLTAGGSEEKTRKAKARMLEIIIGLVVYALIAVLLKWLGLGTITSGGS